MAQDRLRSLGPEYPGKRRPPKVRKDALPIGSSEASGECGGDLLAIGGVIFPGERGCIRRLQPRPVVIAQHDPLPRAGRAGSSP